MRGLTNWAGVAFAAASLAAAAAERPDGFRPLAPGVLTVVPAPVAPPGSAASAIDTVRHDDLLDITLDRTRFEWTPKQSPGHTTFFGRGHGREFARDIWNLEFAFKSPRIIDVDVPGAGMRMQRKRIWYLVYRVRNAGGRRSKIDAADTAQRTTETFETPIRFVPHFVLESLEALDDGEGVASYRAYLDRVIPTALGPIRAREGGGREILDSAAMVAETIGPGEERWGVATWEDIDPRIDFFSIYVRGLTNALEWRRPPREPGKDEKPPGREGVKEAPPGSNMEEALRTLRLDFWRPGDDRDEPEEEMHVGFAGMFERMALGSSLLEAVTGSRRDAANPVNGLRALGLRWSDLLEPVKKRAGPRAGENKAAKAARDEKRDPVPLQIVLDKLAAVPDPAARGAIARDLFGDTGLVAIEELVRALAAPVDADRDATRRAALKPLKLDPEKVAKQPLTSLAAIVGDLDLHKSPADRRAATALFFGAAGRRVDGLVRQVDQARALAVIEALDVPPAEIAAGSSRTAFDAVRPAIDTEADPAKRAAILRGLFGSRGPSLFAAAAAVNEGIDHSWVFRYENEAQNP